MSALQQDKPKRPAQAGHYKGQKMTKPTVGQKIKINVYGRLQTVTVLAVHKFGTIDVETEAGACYRVSGLSFI